MKRLLTLLALTVLLAGCSNMPAPDGKLAASAARTNHGRR